MPVVMQRKVPTVLREQKTMKALQVQFWDEAVDVPVMKQRQVPTVRARKTLQITQVHFREKVVDMPVVMQRERTARHEGSTA